MPTTGDTAILRYGADSKWHYDFLSPGVSSVLSFGVAGATQVTGMGTTTGKIPTVLLPLSVMDLTMTLPMRATGNVVSVDAATVSSAGVISGADLTLVRSALQPGVSIPWATVSGPPTSLSGYGILDGVSTSGSYANPTWLTSFAYSKLSGTPTLGTAAAQNTSAFDASGAASAAQAFAIQRANQTGTQSWTTLTSTPTTLAGYGITDAYPLSGNPSSFTTVSGARGGISLTTTGTSGSATYNSSTGVFNIPTYANSGGTVTSIGLTGTDFTISGSPVTTSGSIALALAASGVSAGTYSGVTVSAKGIVTAGTTRSFNNGQSRSVVTNQTANGTQLSTTRDAHVVGIVSIQNTTTIGGPSSGTIALEICATNSATGSDWTIVDQLVSNSTATLAIVLNLVQNLAKGLNGIVPAGWFHRYRALTATGTISYSSTATCQEVLL